MPKACSTFQLYIFYIAKWTLGFKLITALCLPNLYKTTPGQEKKKKKKKEKEKKKNYLGTLTCVMDPGGRGLSQKQQWLILVWHLLSSVLHLQCYQKLIGCLSFCFDPNFFLHRAEKFSFAFLLSS